MQTQTDDMSTLLAEIFIPPSNQRLTNRFDRDESAVCKPDCSGRCGSGITTVS